ncbi:acyltransferase [Melittangium boletus DSM 14713]|uniref:Acyltransferase n=1 Tax=Melittangium boletus DSM 14713 TaxID=1294270 RepID=A0A250IES2_9BACT|nr:acyltransferase [Melittangium boletus DSM 14713]
METTENPLRRAFFRLAETGAALSARYHRAQLLETKHLPPAGPVLLVGNHGLWGYETPAFFHLLHRATGRYPQGLAERGFFKIPLVKTLLPWLGGVEGTRDNALAALREGHLVVCYPGGAWETFKKPRHHYTLRWEGTLGFARLAARAQVPIIPFAGYGVDGTFVCPEDERWHVSLAPGEKYRVPLGLGLGPLPLPVRMTFVLGAPLLPPRADASDEQLQHFRERIASRVRHLLVRACHA